MSIPYTERSPVGPHFDYQDGPSLFLGRKGVGPLHVAWDTNLLIDYFEHGRALWEGASLPATVAGSYGEELEGLQLVMGLWVIRDIRFHVMPRVVTDGKTHLSEAVVARRRRAFAEFGLALSRVESGDEVTDLPSRDGLLLLPERELHRAVEAVPSGADRALVTDAALFGAHVFLTRDARVLACRDVLRPFGLLIESPLDLLEDLVACGAFHCLFEPRHAYWPFPDLDRVTHLLHALLHDR
jgi:hypothetical protein